MPPARRNAGDLARPQSRQRPARACRRSAIRRSAPSPAKSEARRRPAPRARRISESGAKPTAGCRSGVKVRSPAHLLWMCRTSTRRALLHPRRRERDLIFVGLGVARVARHLVHRRGEQAAALGREIKLVADGLGERQPFELCAGRRLEGDDRAPLRLEAERLDAGMRRDPIGPGPRRVDEHRSGEALAGFAGDRPAQRRRVRSGDRMPVRSSPPQLRNWRRFP